MSDLTSVRDAFRRTTVLQNDRLSAALGAPVVIASETFQHTGSFKFRAAYTAAYFSECGHLLTASSGNYGQALALAAKMLGKKCTVVMPDTSARVKIDAVRGYGAAVDLVDTGSVSRQQRVAELAAQIPDVEVLSAYDDARVILGNSSLGEELAELAATGQYKFDCVIAPIGGGGLTAGILQGMRRRGLNLDLFAAEPLLGNDGAQSLREGRIVANAAEPATIADGARTVSLGLKNFAILKDGLAGVLEVSEEKICEGVRLLFSAANLKAEPTGALGVGAVLEHATKFDGRSPLIVISGGNVDPAVYCRILTDAAV